MTDADRTTLREKLKKLKAVLREQRAIRKELRDELLISETKQRMKKIESWLKKPKKDDAAKVRMMTLEEFKENFKRELEIKEPTQVMIIETVEELRKVWPKIRAENIEIRAPLDVVKEAKKLAREDSSKVKRKGFR